MLVVIVFALVHGGLLAINGQCTMHRCPQDPSLSGGRGVVEELEQHDGRLKSLQKTISTRFEDMEKVFGDFKENYLECKAKDYCKNMPVVCDCAEIRASDTSGSGNYRIHANHLNRSHYADVFCDMTTDNKGWIVFQKRKDGRENFYRGWSDYVNGFGNLDGDFWLGNEFLHILTSKKNYKLRVDLEDFNKVKRYAEYSVFSVASSLDKYRLTIGGYSGDAGDCLREHNEQQFSTLDADNDSYSPVENQNASTNCAERYRGGWWYKACHRDGSNLNGLYYSSGDYSGKSAYEDGITWHLWRGLWYSLKTIEMKISPA